MAEDQEAQPNPEAPESTIEDIVKECMDSEGYVIMVGFIGKQLDKNKFPMLEFRYRRHHYSFSDIDLTCQNMVKIINDDKKKG